ncbi:AAA family ATPase [Undibacterium sp. MH2W]|uniref:AAA family ATPase n=1 Tax=Undibacterium sp. MH2W TaxID=3413044 RepID=UPI003BF442E6
MSALLTDSASRFIDAMAAYLLEPSEIISDGKVHRFATSEDKGQSKTGWYVFYDDGSIAAGAYGDWRTGLSEKWSSKRKEQVSPSEWQKHIELMQQAKAQAEAERIRAQDKAASLCADLWDNASPAPADNPYCQRKGINPYGVRELSDKRTLLVPMRDESGNLTSLQFIEPDGTKRFKADGKIKGSYHSIGGKPVHTLLICEGYATGASLHQATGYPVAVAFHAGNMEAVAIALRAKLGAAIKIIICADNDRKTESKTGVNTGLVAATKAAGAVSGLIAIPHFQNDDIQLTDFNDLHHSEGLQAVKAIMDKANIAAPTPQKTNSQDRAVNIRSGADITPVPITWLWSGWLPAGKLTILAGTAGTGKTTLALGLAATLSTAGKWPDGSHCLKRGNVLIWSSEDVAEDTLLPRLIASGADIKRCHFIEGITHHGENVPFDPSQDMPDLHRAVEKIGGISLLIIDPIVSAVSGDMHKANDVRRSLQAIVDFAEAHLCAVIGITHFAKGGVGKAPQDRVIGSQAFGALARMVLVAAKDEEGERRVLARAKSNIAPDDGGVAYNLNVTTIEGNIETTYATWDGAIEGTAREILGDVEQDGNEDGSERKDAEQFLKDLLADGDKPTKVIKAESSDAGHAWRTIERAKRSLSVEAYREGGQGKGKGNWFWSMPKVINTAKNHLDRQDRQGKNVAVLTDFGGLNEFNPDSDANQQDHMEIEL